MVSGENVSHTENNHGKIQRLHHDCFIRLFRLGIPKRNLYMAFYSKIVYNGNKKQNTGREVRISSNRGYPLWTK